MSVSIDKRRQVAELENFERRILQEKRRLMSELNGLERPFRSARATGWIKDFSSEIVENLRAASEAATFASPIWFYVIAAIVVVGGAGLVTSVALRSNPSERSETTPIQREATYINPASQSIPAIDPPAEVAAPAEPAPLARNVEPANGVRQEQEKAPAVTPMRETLPAAEAVEAPSPEPLPPPAAKANGAAHVTLSNPAAISALDQARPKTAFDDAPPLDMAAPPQPASVERAEPAREVEPAGARRQARCFVKVDGRVIFEHACPVLQPKQSTLMLDLGERPLVLSLGHGRTWTATLGGRSLGKVYKAGHCWGRRKEVYICAYGA